MQVDLKRARNEESLANCDSESMLYQSQWTSETAEKGHSF